MNLFHRFLLRVQRFFSENPMFAWLVVIGFLALAANAARLDTNVKVATLLEGESATLRSYHEHLRSFPRAKTLLALVEPTGAGDFADPKMQAALGEWIDGLFARSGHLKSCFSPFDAREAIFDEAGARLYFPLSLGTRNAHTREQWEKFARSSWAPFFLGRDERSVLVTCRFDDEAPAGQIDRFLAEAARSDAFRVRFTGDALFDVFAASGLARISYLNLASLALIAIVFFLLYRSWVATLVSVSAMALGIGATLGVIAITGHSLDLLSSNLFLLLAVASIEDAYLVFYVSSRKKVPVRDALKALAVPSFYTSLTTAVGFASLLVSEVPAVKRFAIWSTVGVMAEWFLVFCIVPFLVPSWRSAVVKGSRTLAAIDDTVSRVRLPRLLARVLIIPILAAPFFMTSLNYNADPYEVFPRDHEVVKLREVLRETRGWENRLEVAFNAALPLPEKQTLVSLIAKAEGVVWTEHPSLQVRLERVGEARESSPRDAELSQLLDHELRRTDFGRQYVSGGRERAFVYVKQTDIESVQAVAASLRRICGERCEVTGELVAIGSYTDALVRTLAGSLVISLGLAFVVIFGLMRRLPVREQIAVFLSIVWGPATLVLLFAFGGIAVTLISCALLSTVDGLAGDNAIHYLFNARAPDDFNASVEEIGPSAGGLACMMIVLSIPALFSGFANVQATGVLLIASLISMLFGDFVLLRGLIAPKHS